MPGVKTVTVARNPDPAANEAAGTVLTTDLQTFLSNHTVCQPIGRLVTHSLTHSLTYLLVQSVSQSVSQAGRQAHTGNHLFTYEHRCIDTRARTQCQGLMCPVHAYIAQVLTEEIFGPATLVVQCEYVERCHSLMPLRIKLLTDDIVYFFFTNQIID